jgi:hypothetical protein
MESKIMLELRLQIVEDILGKLGRQLAKVEKETYRIEVENRRRERVGKNPLIGLNQEEKERNERQSKALRMVMTTVRIEWTTLTNQLKKFKEV